jgi:cell wall-associated NlpC family hydrolase
LSVACSKPVSVSDLVGKPFEWKARGPHAYDCWGLVRECLLRAGLRDVPDYRSATEGAANAVTMLDAMANGWRKLRAPGPGAVVVINTRNRGHWHVGFMLTAETFLHVTEQTIGGSVIERLWPMWGNLVIGYYVWDPRTTRLACARSL